MKTMLAIVTCVLLTSASIRAAFGPLDLELHRAAGFMQVIEERVAAESDRMAIYVELSLVQLRALAKLPIVHDVARALGLDAAAELSRAARAPLQPSRERVQPCGGGGK